MDLSPATLDMLVHLMCAQARECLFEKVNTLYRFHFKITPGFFFGVLKKKIKQKKIKLNEFFRKLKANFRKTQYPGKCLHTISDTVLN